MEVFVCSWQSAKCFFLSQFAKFVSLKFQNLFFSSNCKIYLSQIANCICFKLQIVFVSNFQNGMMKKLGFDHPSNCTSALLCYLQSKNKLQVEIFRSLLGLFKPLCKLFRLCTVRIYIDRGHFQASFGAFILTPPPLNCLSMAFMLISAIYSMRKAATYFHLIKHCIGAKDWHPS